MSDNYQKYESAPIEWMHGRMIDLFHEWRRTKTDDTTVEINGLEFSRIIAKAKTETYEKYKKLNLGEPILKSALK